MAESRLLAAVAPVALSAHVLAFSFSLVGFLGVSLPACTTVASGPPPADMPPPPHGPC